MTRSWKVVVADCPVEFSAVAVYVASEAVTVGVPERVPFES